MTFTKNELRQLFVILSRLEQPLAAPLTAADLLAAGALCRKTETLIRAGLHAVERGPKIFEWRIDPEWAPTMNEHNSWMQRTPWRPKKTKAELRRQVTEIVESTKGADLCGAQRKRWVRVTRFTVQPNRLDDFAPDQIGGKLPIDVMTKMGIFVDDTPQWLHREGGVAKTARGNTHVLIEVFELADEQASDAPPIDAPRPGRELRAPGEYTKAITEACEPAPERRHPFGDR